MAHIIDDMELTDKEFRAYTKTARIGTTTARHYVDAACVEDFASGNRRSKWVESGKIPAEGNVVITDNDTTYMFSNGHLHNDNGPAITGAKGDYWFVNGVIHREDGPAMLCSNTHGSRYILYVVNGRLHRTDGPAFVITDADPGSYWLHAQQFTAEEHAAFIAKLKLHGKTL